LSGCKQSAVNDLSWPNWGAHKTAEHREAVTAFIEKRAPNFDRLRDPLGYSHP